MSHAAEFRRLLTHAAERLNQEHKNVLAAFDTQMSQAVQRSVNRESEAQTVSRKTGSYMAATTYARLVMETVAAFLVDSEPGEEES